MKTSSISRASAFHLRAVCQRAYMVAETRVVCTLYTLEGNIGGAGKTESAGYAIGMCTPDSRFLYFLGHHAAWATDVFERVTKYEVSPCTLKDVLDDLATVGS